MKYETLPVIETKESVDSILETGTIDELVKLAFSIGENFYDWKYAQDVCIKLMSNENLQVRRSACFGLAYLARTKGKLEKHLVKPAILKVLREDEEIRGCVLDAVGDINHYMNWKLAHKWNS